MVASLFVSVEDGTVLRVCRDVVRLRTEKPLQFVDLTALVAERVRRSGIRDGTITVQSLHTTTAVVVNEHEPLLLDRLRRRCSSVGARATRATGTTTCRGATREPAPDERRTATPTAARCCCRPRPA